MSAGDSIIAVEGLQKTYRTPFRRKRVDALGGISFSVKPGEIFGFLGPNGAGKTTTIRILMGLISATGGTAKIFGHQIPSRKARERLGFLPEQPYFYDYLSVEELCDLAGRLFGIDSATRKKRADELITRVGLDRARGQSLRKYSKGMMQRAGLAQALMNDPDLIVLDEPMSGLDPVGRKEVRDLILAEKARGKTIFFSSHILNDVETISDRVAIVARGKIRATGTPDELVSETEQGAIITWNGKAEGSEGRVQSELAKEQLTNEKNGSRWQVAVPLGSTDEWLQRIAAAGGSIVAVSPRRDSLEDVFMRYVKEHAQETIVP